MILNKTPFCLYLLHSKTLQNFSTIYRAYEPIEQFCVGGKSESSNRELA